MTSQPKSNNLKDRKNCFKLLKENIGFYKNLISNRKHKFNKVNGLNSWYFDEETCKLHMKNHLENGGGWQVHSFLFLFFFLSFFLSFFRFILFLPVFLQGDFRLFCFAFSLSFAFLFHFSG